MCSKRETNESSWKTKWGLEFQIVASAQIFSEGSYFEWKIRAGNVETGLAMEKYTREARA